MPDLVSTKVQQQAQAIASNGSLGWEARISQIQALYKQNGLTISYDQANDLVADSASSFPPPTTDIDGDGKIEGADEDVVVVGTRPGSGGPVSEPAEIVAPRADHRIRISAFSRSDSSVKEQVYGPNDSTKNILAPLWKTDGLMFPYTPSIQVSQDTSYQSADLEHSNYDILSWQRSSSATISITAKFTVQNQREGLYLLAAIHFLRTVSKSYFGAQDAENFAPTKSETPGTTSETTPEQNAEQAIRDEAASGRAGLPPPVLLFSGYGDYMFNDVRVVVKSHSWAYDENADLVKIKVPSGGNVWLPPLMTLSITLSLQQNTDKLRTEFNLDSFRTGELLKKGGWF